MIRRGFGYIEALVAAAILGTGLAAALTTYGVYAQGTAADRETAVATELAAQLAAEIRSQAFEDPVNPILGPETGEADGTRQNFDDVDDYHNYSASPPQLRDGTVLTSLTGYKQEVSIVIDGASIYKKITITISKNGRERAKVAMARGAHDADQP